MGEEQGLFTGPSTIMKLVSKLVPRERQNAPTGNSHRKPYQPEAGQAKTRSLSAEEILQESRKPEASWVEGRWSGQDEKPLRRGVRTATDCKAGS